MIHFAVDEVENDVARLEGDDGSSYLLPLGLLPPGTRSGDVLAVERCAAGDQLVSRWWRDEAERRRRTLRARAILERLAVGDDGADVEL